MEDMVEVEDKDVDVVVEVEGYMEDMPTLAMELVLAVQVLVEAAMLEIYHTRMIKSRFPAKNSPTFSPMKPSRTSSVPTP